MPLVAQPFRVKNLSLPSRLVRGATAERIAVEDDTGAHALGAVYQRLGDGGVGLIVTGHVAVHPTGAAHATMAGVWADRQRAAWRRVLEQAHATPAKIVMQINHAGGRARAEILGREPWCVSPVERPGDAMLGREMGEDEIAELIAAFASAAAAAVEAGADGVQIHAAHGYLISQFLSPLTNRRADRWGGDFQGRSRFAREATRAARKAIGPDAALGVKLGAADGDPAGLTVEQSVSLARELEDAGLDFIEISGAFHPDVIRRKISSPKDEGYYLDWARRFKEALRIPVVSVGGFRTLAVIEEALASGACDLVSVSRPLIRQPDLLRRLAAGETATCASCNRCLFSREGPTRCRLEDRQDGPSAP